jgi:hypothetical protein
MHTAGRFLPFEVTLFHVVALRAHRIFGLGSPGGSPSLYTSPSILHGRASVPTSLHRNHQSPNRNS